MAFDIDQVLTDMTKSVLSTTSKKGKKALAQAEEFFEERKARLERLALRRLNETIDDAMFLHFMEQEKEVMQAEILAMKIASKAAAQSAVNGAMGVLQKAVETALDL